MGGRIWVESKVGVGTAFHCTVRFGVQDPNDIPVAAELHELQGLPVLVVDDNATNLRILQEMLSQWGLEPTLASSPQQAMELLQQVGTDRPFKLLISDVNMPDLDGFDFLAWVRQQSRWKEVTTMLLTSSRTSGDTARAKAINVSALLTKPIKQSTLLDAIGSAMGANRSQLGPAPEESEPDSEIGPLRILLAEDHPPNQQLAVRLLERRGHSVVVANHGREALEILENESFDLLLTDIQMPELDGFGLTEAIRASEQASGRHLPIIAMTAHAMKGDADRCLSAGMDGYVSKPVRRSALYAAIEEVIRQAAANRLEPQSVAAEEATDEIAGEVLDEDGLKEEYEGDEDLLAEMFQSYFDLVPGLLGGLQSAIEAKHAQTVSEIAHTLKGGSGNFFAKSAFESALALEQMGKDCNLSGAAKGLQRLRDDLDRLKLRLQECLKIE